MLEILHHNSDLTKTFPASDSGNCFFIRRILIASHEQVQGGLIMCLYTESFKEWLWVIAVLLINMAATHSIRLAISYTDAKVMYYFFRAI